MKSKRLEQLYNFLENSPNDSFLLFAIAKEYEKLQDKESALKYYLKLTKEDPDYVGTYYHLGKLYERLDQITTAFFTYKRGMVIAKKINDQHAFSELAGAKMELGDDDDFEDV
ncbi:MAG: tetratricopeptide repeat protein [Bacteroidetes bacterium]|jgi:tetratricopeptide (TPR) repeat protein|nr:tetratricopeptide repeat protein [Bacteroidota bacterium]MDF1864478.1 tetratricopeptide repeat protein [Saprospiraceae bacterium]